MKGENPSDSEMEEYLSFNIQSTFLRELSFVSHHSVHHMSSIRLISENMNVFLPTEFGLAPSTKNHIENNDVNLSLNSSKITK